MIRELITDEAILSQPCEPATAEDAELANDLVMTLLSNDRAAALCANQIGVPKALFTLLVSEDGDTLTMFNAELKKGLHPFKAVEECLSHEGETKVTRFQNITVVYEELVDGELVVRRRNFSGWVAQCIQHMIDHCKGRLI